MASRRRRIANQPVSVRESGSVAFGRLTRLGGRPQVCIRPDVRASVTTLRRRQGAQPETENRRPRAKETCAHFLPFGLLQESVEFLRRQYAMDHRLGDENSVPIRPTI